MAMINTEADFLRALREHPEWKASVRAQILGEELLQLPVQFQAFVQQQQQFNDRMQEFVEQQREFNDQQRRRLTVFNAEAGGPGPSRSSQTRNAIQRSPNLVQI